MTPSVPTLVSEWLGRPLVVPSFQRSLVWGYSQGNDLVDDLWREWVKAMEQGANRAHQLGFSVLHDEDGEEPVAKGTGIPGAWAVIDGQQRITALTMLLCSNAFILRMAEHEVRGLTDGAMPKLLL